MVRFAVRPVCGSQPRPRNRARRARRSAVAAGKESQPCGGGSAEGGSRPVFRRRTASGAARLDVRDAAACEPSAPSVASRAPDPCPGRSEDVPGRAGRGRASLRQTDTRPAARPSVPTPVRVGRAPRRAGSRPQARRGMMHALLEGSRDRDVRGYGRRLQREDHRALGLRARRRREKTNHRRRGGAAGVGRASRRREAVQVEWSPRGVVFSHRGQQQRRTQGEFPLSTTRHERRFAAAERTVVPIRVRAGAAGRAAACVRGPAGSIDRDTAAPPGSRWATLRRSSTNAA